MTSHHAAELRALHARLVESFRFQTSRVDLGIPTFDGVPAVFVRGGGYREPLTVRTYYITVSTEQDTIIELVSQFLAGRELDQAAVEFYQAEVWETWREPDGQSSGGRRGEETLLRRALLNC